MQEMKLLHPPVFDATQTLAWAASIPYVKCMQEEEAGDGKEIEDVAVSQGDFWSALRELRPSLSLEELERYSALRRQYECPVR